jgi:hypothetical protein
MSVACFSRSRVKSRLFSTLPVLAVALGLVGSAGMARAALLSNVVFNDNLSSSTLDQSTVSYPNAATPTSTSTNYDIASSKEAVGGTPTSSLSSGDLSLYMVSTSSGVNEVQALFTTTPVALSTIGNAIEITSTFKNTGGLNQNSSSDIDMGLYSSGGNAPYSNLQNGSSTSNTVTGLVNTEINDNAGGVQNWAGYESDYFGGSSTKEYSRPAQATSTNNADQALLAEGQTGGPTGTQATYTSQNSSESLLTVGNTYTDELLITLTSAGTYTLTEALYNGSTDTGTQVGTNTVGTITALSSGGFDGLALGYRESDSMAAEMDISSIEVTTNVAIPEPTSFSLLVLGGAGLLSRRRKATKVIA